MTAIHLAVYKNQKRGQAKMEIKEILKHVDHTLLLQPSTWEEVKQICDDAEKFLSLGADRLGTSRIVKIVKNEEATGY